MHVMESLTNLAHDNPAKFTEWYNFHTLYASDAASLQNPASMALFQPLRGAPS